MPVHYVFVAAHPFYINGNRHTVPGIYGAVYVQPVHKPASGRFIPLSAPKNFRLAEIQLRFGLASNFVGQTLRTNHI